MISTIKKGHCQRHCCLSQREREKKKRKREQEQERNTKSSVCSFSILVQQLNDKFLAMKILLLVRQPSSTPCESNKQGALLLRVVLCCVVSVRHFGVVRVRISRIADNKQHTTETERSKKEAKSNKDYYLSQFFQDFPEPGHEIGVGRQAAFVSRNRFQERNVNVGLAADQRL